MTAGSTGPLKGSGTGCTENGEAAPARQRKGVVAPAVLIVWWALCAFVVYFIGVSAGWW